MERMLLAIAILFVGPVIASQVARSVEAELFGNRLEDLVRADGSKQLSHWRSLGERGHMAAQYKLGLVYDKGIGVPQPDYAEAVKWYRKAAEQGFAPAQYNLGLMYTIGLGVSGRDNARAVMWWQKAAEQGDAKAQLSLGLMYAWGRGVSRDRVNAHVWLSFAAAAGTPVAANMRYTVSASMTAAEIAEAERLARLRQELQ